MTSATLTPQEAAGHSWHAVVVGAGPAGATAAGLLARRGLAVLLVDRAAFPRPKVCGCCLNGRALAALAAADLGDLPARCGAVPLHGVRLSAGGAAAEVRLPGGVALSRTAFDDALVAAAIRRGAHFLPATAAALLPDDGDERMLRLGSAGVRAAVVLAADGLGGRLLGRIPAAAGSRVGAGVVLAVDGGFYRPGIVYMAIGPGGYLGLVRLEDGRLDLACAADVAALRGGGPGAVAADLLRRAGWPVPDGLAAAGWRGTPPLTRPPTAVAGHRVFAVGDAAGYVEPFTGEGMAWALAGAVAVAPLAALPWRPALASAWQRRHRRIVGQRQRTCRVAAAVLRRPWLCAAAVRLLAAAPALAAGVLRALNRTDSFPPPPQGVS